LSDPLVLDFTIFFDLAGVLTLFFGLFVLGFLAAFGLAGDLALDPDAFPVFCWPLIA
jgi:hypothetical protein